MQSDSPFASSSKTGRSPTRSSSRIRNQNLENKKNTDNKDNTTNTVKLTNEISTPQLLIKQEQTENQQTSNNTTPTNTETINTENNTENQQTSNDTTPTNTETINTRNHTENQQTSNDKTPTNTKVINTKNNTETENKMNQREMQQNIASFVPEFNGEEPYITNNLTRFTDTADSIYDYLTNAEKLIFDKLIKFRLTGDAYMRTSKREIQDYPALKSLLNRMYTVTLSLDELEKAYTNTQQNYGETIRRYGNRLIETLDQYKTGYKIKYGLNEIDKSYKTHLETAAVQIFKRGLNNTILREKVATIKAKDIEEIIDETEIIEKMLIMSTGTTTIPNNSHTNERIKSTEPYTQIQPQIRTQPTTQPRPTPILCNFCQKPNHTWDVCRTRMANSNIYNNTTNFNTKPQFQTQQNQFSPRRQFQTNQFPPQKQFQANQYSSQNQFQQRQFTQRTQPQQNQYQPNNYPIQNNHYPQTSNFNTYRQPPRQSNYQPKYCSHCKTTTGHTFEECRSKFYGPQNPPTNNYPKQHQQTNRDELEQKFTNMKINPVFSNNEYQPPDEIHNQGNSNGSSQT